MKKIGILSMQRIKNYGSFMQAYGLKSIIENLGFEVEFVDYEIEPCIVVDSKKNIKDTVIYKVLQKVYRKIKPTKENMIRKEKMEEFRRRYNEEFLPLLGIDSKMHYRTNVDTLVIGSDEVFNCLQSNPAVGYSKELFGFSNNAKKVITYAASFGNTTIERLKKYDKQYEIAGFLKEIDVISVRDANSGKVVNALIGNEPMYHLDPVLMYDFSSLIDENVVKHKDYIIIYAYEGRIKPEEAEIIRCFANRVGKKLISISGYQDFCDEHLVLNPFEVLAYFKKADSIITDTFHGSIFSIINNRQFVTIIRNTQGDSYGNEEKLTDLLTRLHLEDRIIKDMSDLEELMDKVVDYSETNKIIMEQRKKTKEYLENNL